MARETADNLLGEYAELFDIMERLTDEYPGGLAEPYPKNWRDPLELYGCYRRSLEIHAVDLEQERSVVSHLMKEEHYSPATIWHARLNLAARRIFENGLN